MNKIVLLDIDGTLVTAPSAANKPASQVMFKKVFNVDAHEEMVENVGKTEKHIILEVLRKIVHREIQEVPENAYRIWAEASAKVLKENPAKVLPGVHELLRGLEDEKIPYGILTGNNSYRAKAKLASARIGRYFQDKEGGLRGAFGEMAYDREELINIAKERMGYPRALAILVDDSLFVARMINRLGIPHVMVATGDVAFDQLKGYVPNVVKSFAGGGWKEAIDIIKRY